MVFSVAAATARRRIAVTATRQVAAQGQKRSMGGPPPEWEGIDKVVRGVFPADHQLAMAIMGGYGGLYMLFKMKSAMTKKAPVKEVAPATSSAPSGGIPSIESDEFGDWLGSDAFNAYVEKA
eukprot:CAMPEP_0201121730 /NCGR_PEP_ID=MMETSP0850-20130426/5551_1 /ASSEMBLY_ACC=CAM_ASM_000622 /TAXON_ID=183588 /ORGANISM="Pseudo-nitzschia fraudulenta, Strain WWA7" /LENGTH=121 /DNA_ID=CAMNT_0047388275 /DNA_START=50 /DNA_END=415 /DNA_ORIENTATION=-